MYDRILKEAQQTLLHHSMQTPPEICDVYYPPVYMEWDNGTTNKRNGLDRSRGTEIERP